MVNIIDAKQPINNGKYISSKRYLNLLTISKIDLPIALGLLTISGYFGNVSTQTTNFILIAIYGIMSTICLIIGIFFIWLCKKRVTDKLDIPIKERFKTMCPRCMGIVIGASIIVFPLIIISTEFTPILDVNWGIISLFIGFLLSLPATSHGLYHGVQKKEFGRAIDGFISIITGFCLSLGGYLVFLSFVSIFG